jgi:hypothetical protein
VLLLLVLLVFVGLVLGVVVVVGSPVGIVKPLGKEKEFSDVVVGRPVGMTIPLGRENDGFPKTIDSCGRPCTTTLNRMIDRR